MNVKINNIILGIVVILTVLGFIIFIGCSFFANDSIDKNYVSSFVKKDDMAFDTIGGVIIMNITNTNDNSIIENSTTLVINYQAKSDQNMVCSYDIVYELVDSNKYLGLMNNDITIQATLTNTENVYSGINHIQNETDLTSMMGSYMSATVVEGAQISGVGDATSTAIWTIVNRINHVPENLIGQTYEGRFQVSNVSCTNGIITNVT